MPKILDLTGQRFERLCVVRLLRIQPGKGKIWLCICDCGNEKQASTEALRCGDIKSCSCLGRLDLSLIGKVFGHLTIIGKTSITKNGKRISGFECKCRCGAATKAEASDLRMGFKRSCGCGTGRSAHDSAALACISRYRQGAKKRGMAWELPAELCVRLFLSNCAYCGCPPSNRQGGFSACVGKRQNVRRSAFFYNGIDRVDSSLGYLEPNVVACCRLCNWAKRTMSVEEFLDWALRVASHQQAKPKSPKERSCDTANVFGIGTTQTFLPLTH